jgi:hypothetical protein
MAVLGAYVQQPREAISYVIDYSCWLDAAAVEILDPGVPTLIITPATTPPLVVTGAISGTDKVKLLVSGGIDGTQYKNEVVVSTSEGQIKEDEVKFTIRDF